MAPIQDLAVARTTAASTVPSSTVKSIRALRRGLDVLAAIEQVESTGFADLQRQTGLPKASLLRVLRTLHEAGRIIYREETRRYHLVRDAAPVVTAPAAWYAPLVEAAGPALAALQRQVVWPIVMAVRDGRAMLVVHAGGPSCALTMNHQALGARPPMLISSLGRCYLAFCPDAERRQILDGLTRSSHPHDIDARRPGRVSRFLAQARAQGYACRDASTTSADSPERFGALAVPVLLEDRVVACLAVSWVPDGVDDERIRQAHLGRLLQAAGLIGRRFRAVRLAPP